MKTNWQTKKLGEICKISTGKSNANEAIEHGKYAFFDRSKTIKKSSRFIFDCEALIIPGEGAEFSRGIILVNLISINEHMRFLTLRVTL